MKRRTMLAAMAGFLVAAVAVPADVCAVGASFALPATTGPYRIGTTTLHLVDRSRTDPFVGGRRELMVTITYPTTAQVHGRSAPWLDAALVPYWEAVLEPYGFAPGSVDWGGARRPAIEDAPLRHVPHGWPVVLFSPGLQFFRELYSASIDDLASHGYVVVSMTHTYEAQFAAFPGGRVAAGVPLEETVQSTQMWLDTRVADSRFVLDALQAIDCGRNPDAEHRRLPAGLRGGLDLLRIGFYGHSYGGTTAAETMFHDGRVEAGLNFDGQMSTTYGPPTALPYGPILAARYGLDRPFLLMGARTVNEDYHLDEVHTHLPNSDPSWQDFWRNQRGWKRDVAMPLGRHFSFSDYPAIMPQLPGTAPAEFLPLASGTIPPAEAVAGVRAYVAAFFDLHLKGIPTTRFDLADAAYPDFELIP